MPILNSSRGSDYAGLPVPATIRENSAHKAIFEELVSAGVDQTALSSHLFVLGMLARLPATDVIRKASPWPEIAMTKSQLQRLPQRISTMAREIEQLNTASLFDPVRWVPTSDSPDNEVFLKFLVEMHSRLPGFLYTYAAYLRRRLARLVTLGRRSSLLLRPFA
jgi:hypothetical protein